MRFECFGNANSSDTCLQCPDNEECAKVTCSKTYMPCPHKIGMTGDCGHCEVGAPWADIHECPFKDEIGETKK